MHRSALVGATDLRTQLADGDPPRLLDVRWTLAGAQPEHYRHGHLPGAVFCDLDAELAGPPGDGGRHPLPSAQHFSEVMRRLGIGPSTEVVAYDAGTPAPMAAARAWWVLRWFGHPGVRVLDGGLMAWLAAGGAIETGSVAPAPAPDAVVHPGSMPVLTLAQLSEQVLRSGRPDGILLDARAHERFTGTTEPVDPVAGHIPGAVNLPMSLVVGRDGRLLATDALRAALHEALPSAPGDDAQQVAASCGSGVTAAVLVLALHEIGVDAALFPGSWSQWVRDPTRPVATGC